MTMVEQYIHPVNPESLRFRPQIKGVRQSGKVFATDRDASKIYAHMENCLNLTAAIQQVDELTHGDGDIVTGPAVDMARTFRSRRTIFEHQKVGLWVQIKKDPEKLMDWLKGARK